MKWYKKQLMELEKKQSAAKKGTKTAKAPSSKKAGHTFDAQKIRGHKSVFPNPVSNRNRNRPKTDSL